MHNSIRRMFVARLAMLLFVVGCGPRGEILEDCAVDPCASTTCSDHGTCSEGICSCDAGYAGDDCSSCAEGYTPTGDGCVADTDACAGIDCSGHGTCDGGSCACSTGYTGQDCADCDDGYVPSGDTCVEDTDPCAGVGCSDHGTCSGGSCACDSGYAGLDCSSCDEGYVRIGDACIEESTDPCAEVDCSNHGACSDGLCVCNTGYDGATCSSCADGYVPHGTACVLDDPQGHAFNYAGIPYPTDALPGIAGQPSTMAIMPTLPNGSHYTAHDWYAGNSSSYDPFTIETPTPTPGGAPDEYYVDLYGGDDSTAGQNGQGTISAPRRTLPSYQTEYPAGTKIFVDGQDTPYTTDGASNREVAPDGSWRSRTLTFSCSAAAPCWIVGIDKPRLPPKLRLSNTSHLIFDGIAIEGTGFGDPEGLHADDTCTYITFRNGRIFPNDVNMGGPQFYWEGSFAVLYNSEIAYGGAYTSSSSSTRDRHGVLPSSTSRFLWVVDNHIHHMSGDSMQTGNSGQTGGMDHRPHYVFFAGNEGNNNKENFLDLKPVYHVIASHNHGHDFVNMNPPDTLNPPTVIILSNDGEGTYTGYHWALFNVIHDGDAEGIRFAGTEEGESAYAIGNIIHNQARGIDMWKPWIDGSIKVAAHNTLSNCGSGIDAQSSGSDSAHIERVHGNVVLNSGTIAGTTQVIVDSVTDNFVYDSSGPQTITGSWVTNSGNQVNVDPQVTANFAPAADSPVKGYTTADPAIALFEELYGISIAVDQAGKPRPTDYAAGALE